jgi:hypothetical protein
MGSGVLRKKIIILIGMVFVIIALFFIVKYTYVISSRDTIEDITVEEYQTYNKYGIIYDGNESEIFNFLKERLDIDDFELSVETENLRFYNDTSDANVKLIKSLLNDCKEINELLYTKESNQSDILYFFIDYINNRDKRIILEYTYNGIVRKTFREKKSVVEISSELRKKIYRD